MPNSIHSIGKDDEKAEVQHLDQAVDTAGVMAAARQADPGPGWGDARWYKFMAIVTIACAASADVGFDGTIIGTVNSMDTFHKYFGLYVVDYVIT